jgi:hypothetical protein
MVGMMATTNKRVGQGVIIISGSMSSGLMTINCIIYHSVVFATAVGRGEFEESLTEDPKPWCGQSSTLLVIGLILGGGKGMFQL